MKKILMALIVAVMLLSGCAKVENAEPTNVSRFKMLESSATWCVVADRETGVMYAVSGGVYNQGNFTVLVDADILAKLEAVGNVQGYIKELIRADIKSGQ